jgi:hypothetical protein
VSRLRARPALDRIALAVVVVGIVLLVASLVNGSGGEQTRDEAVRLVPADALLYVAGQPAVGARRGDRAPPAGPAAAA